jgi:hypothetical protein
MSAIERAASYGGIARRAQSVQQRRVAALLAIRSAKTCLRCGKPNPKVGLQDPRTGKWRAACRACANYLSGNAPKRLSVAETRQRIEQIRSTMGL